MPKRRHSSERLVPPAEARRTNSVRSDTADDSFQGMATLLSEVSLANEKCQPCPRTPVNHVSGLHTLRGEGRVGGKRLLPKVAASPPCEGSPPTLPSPRKAGEGRKERATAAD